MAKIGVVFALTGHACVIKFAWEVGARGLRRGEIRALRCSDVELHNNRLVVRLSRYRQVTKETKSGSDREVPLSPQLRAALLAAGVQTRPHGDAVALTTLGKPWSSDGPALRAFC